MQEKTIQLQQLTQSAYAAVKDLEASDDYKLAGFKIVLKSMLGGVDSPAAGTPPEPAQKSVGMNGTADWQAKIASRMDISADDVLEIYHHTDDGQLELIIEAKALPKSNSKSTQHIAALLSAGRQALEIERATPFEDIRKACESYRVYDSKNFSTYVRQLGPKFRFEGTSANRTVELTNGAYKAASDVAKTYLEQK